MVEEILIAYILILIIMAVTAFSERPNFPDDNKKNGISGNE